MREAYGLLAAQFSEDESWHKLVWAATAASLGFRKYRKEFSNASRLCRRVAEVSADLTSLLEQLGDCHVHVPNLYFLINKQGSTYDNLVSIYDDNLVSDMPWLYVEDVLEKLAEAARTTASDIDNRTQDPSNPFAWDIAYFGHNSPQRSLVMSALKTRQSCLKTEYLRAFGCGLEFKDPDALTPAVQKAMAHIATVVINDPDVVVTYDDVRAVFTKGRQRVKGKSSKKSRASFPTLRKTARSKGE
jgi:hypothetical protein